VKTFSAIQHNCTHHCHHQHKNWLRRYHTLSGRLHCRPTSLWFWNV